MQAWLDCNTGKFVVGIDITVVTSTDIDECSASLSNKYNLCEARETCFNTPGSYDCSCQYPDVLASDGRRCLGKIDCK